MTELTGRDAKMVLTAVVRGWDIPPDVVSELPEMMRRIASDQGESSRDRIAAAKVLAAMKASNDKQARPRRPKPATGNTIVLMGDNLEDAKRELLSRIGQVGADAGRVEDDRASV